MFNIEIAKEFISLEELDNEIKIRQDLRDSMVGTLYPAVVQEEINKLYDQRNKIEKIVKRNYEYYGKRYNH